MQPFQRATCKSLVQHIAYTLYESESEVAQSCLILCDPMDCIPQPTPSMEFSKQEYWSGLPFPSPNDLPDPGIKPGSPTLQADSLPSELPEPPNTALPQARRTAPLAWRGPTLHPCTWDAPCPHPSSLNFRVNPPCSCLQPWHRSHSRSSIC